MTTDNLNDSYTIQQINDTFDYFLNKLSSDKASVRHAALKILHKLFISTNSSSHILINHHQQQSAQIDLMQLLDTIRELAAFNIYLQPLLLKYFRRALMVETNPHYLQIYISFVLEQLIGDYDRQHDSSSPSMDVPLRSKHNEIAVDLGSFFFQRPYCFDSVLALANKTNESEQMRNLFSRFNKLFFYF